MFAAFPEVVDESAEIVFNTYIRTDNEGGLLLLLKY